jgi:hypothetical protein
VAAWFAIRRLLDERPRPPTLCPPETPGFFRLCLGLWLLVVHVLTHTDLRAEQADADRWQETGILVAWGAIRVSVKDHQLGRM